MTSASQDSFDSKLFSRSPSGGIDRGGFLVDAYTPSESGEAVFAGGTGHSSSAGDNSRFATHIYALQSSRRTPSLSPVSRRHTNPQEPLSEDESECVSAESTDQPPQSFSEDAEDDPEGHWSGAQPEPAVVGDAYADSLAGDSQYAEEEQDTGVLQWEVAVPEGGGEGVAPSSARVDGAGDDAMQILALAAELGTSASHFEPNSPQYSAFVQLLPADSNQTPTEFTRAPSGPTTEVNFNMRMPSFDSALNDGQLPPNELDLALDPFDPSTNGLHMPSAPFTWQAQHDAFTQVQQTIFGFDGQHLAPQSPLSFAPSTSDNDMPSGAKRSYTEFDDNLVNPTSYPMQSYSAFSPGSAYLGGGRRRKQVRHHSFWASSGVQAIMKDGATSIQPLSPGDQLCITEMTDDDPDGYM